MKIAVLNFSGNVGKTTVAAHLLKPRMGDAPVFSVESINLDASTEGVEVERIKGAQFGELQEQLMLLNSAIVDVGASNVEDFLKRMQQYAGSHSEFDLFVIPTVKEKKQQADTINTIQALKSIGVPSQKIRVIFNKLETDEHPADEFPSIFGLHTRDGSFALDPAAVIHANEVFDRLKGTGKTISQISSEPDYRPTLKNAKTADEKQHIVNMVSIQRMSVPANANLDAVFATLTR